MGFLGEGFLMFGDWNRGRGGLFGRIFGNRVCVCGDSMVWGVEDSRGLGFKGWEMRWVFIIFMDEEVFV